MGRARNVAGDRIRTGTVHADQGILSPRCLPFHHSGAGPEPNDGSDAGSNLGAPPPPRTHLTVTPGAYYRWDVYALVEIKGKQYRVSPGTEIVVDRLSAAQAESFDLDSVLLLSDGRDVRVGNPYVADARVRARVAGEERGRKIRVSTYRRRKRTQRTRGHRQRYTRLVIEDVVAGAAGEAAAS